MHYYIDGYNLLFRYIGDSEDLHKHRQQLVDELNQKFQQLKMHVTIVFDAQYQFGESTRSHFQNVEILFSAYGETADDLILEKVKEASKPKEVIVVTSDKKLAWFARRCTAQTQSVEFFMNWLTKSSKSQKKKKIAVVQTPPSSPSKKPSKHTKAEECSDYYLKQFEERYAKNETKRPPKREPNKKVQDMPSKKEENISNTERWRRLFEQRLKDDLDSSANDL